MGRHACCYYHKNHNHPGMECFEQLHTAVWFKYPQYLNDGRSPWNWGCLGLGLICVEDALYFLDCTHICLFDYLLDRQIGFGFVMNGHVDGWFLGVGEWLAERGAHSDWVVEGFVFDLDLDGFDWWVWGISLVDILPMKLKLLQDRLDFLGVNNFNVESLLAGVNRVPLVYYNVLIGRFVIFEHGYDG